MGPFQGIVKKKQRRCVMRRPRKKNVAEKGKKTKQNTQRELMIGVER